MTVQIKYSVTVGVILIIASQIIYAVKDLLEEHLLQKVGG